MTRIPIHQIDRRVEEVLERDMNMGWFNGQDPEVDARSTISIPLREMMLGQVIKGQRPLTEVLTSDVNAFNSAFADLTLDVPKGRKVDVRELAGLTGEGHARLVIYDPVLARARITENAASLHQLGVDTSVDLGQIIDQLDRLPQGLHILQARDPKSSIMYSWYRSNSMKRDMMSGPTILDETGPHRVYSEEQKQTFAFKRC
jgi:hypothetical protein